MRGAAILMSVFLLVGFLSAVARAQDLYVSNGDGTIRKIAPSGTMSVVENGIPNATGLVFDKQGNLYAGSSKGFIAKITPGKPASLFVGSGLEYLSGMVFNEQGILFAAEWEVTAVTPDGRRHRFTTKFEGATGITIDRQGNLYVAKTEANLIYKITPHGEIRPFVTSLTRPFTVAMDAHDNLYVGVRGDESIVKVSPNGKVTPFASGFHGIYGLAFDKQGNLYAANMDNDTINKITPGGKVTVFSTQVKQPRYLVFAPSRPARKVAQHK